MNDAISNQRLALCAPVVIARVNIAANQLAMQGIYFRIVQGLRTYAEQAAVPAGNTNAPPGYSWHNFGMAVDCAPFVSGSSGPIEWDANSPNFKAMIQVLTNAGMPQRGGCRGDNDHFELPEIPAVPQDADREAFANGGLEAVWQQYTITP